MRTVTLGHWPRYTQAFELETLLAECFRNTYQKPVPKASLFYFVCDNNDLYEETLSEEGITHGTNGIVVRGLFIAIVSIARL